MTELDRSQMAIQYGSCVLLAG